MEMVGEVGGDGEDGSIGVAGENVTREQWHAHAEAVGQVAVRWQGAITTDARASRAAFSMYYSADIPLKSSSNFCIFENA